MPRVCVMLFNGQWYQYLPLCEFAYNDSYHCSIDMASSEDFMVKGAGVQLDGLMHLK